MLRGAALAVAGLLTCSALSACTEQTPVTVPGEVVAGRPSTEVVGDSGFVLLPSGRVDVVVGEPRDGTVAAEDAADDLDHQAPENGSWIPVHVAHDPFGEMGVPVGLMGGAPQPAQVALVVDGTTISLGAPYRVVGEQGTADSGLDNVWVALDARPDEVESVHVAVTYDGLTQTLDPETGVREPGAAEPLYVEEAEELQADCPVDGFDAGPVRLDLACAIGPAHRTPYLPGAGWAEDGRSWLVVGVAVSIRGAAAGDSAYDVIDIGPSMTVDGEGPLPPGGRFGEIRRDPDRVSVTWAFDAPSSGAVAATLTLGLVLAKDDPDDPGPGTRRLTVTQPVELG